MKIDKNRRRAITSWLFVGALFVLCGVLAVLQYRWTGEVSLAESDRLRAGVQASLNRLSQEFNSEIAVAARALLPANSPPEAKALETELATRYEQWKKAGRHGQLFRAIAIVFRQGDDLRLRSLDLQTGQFSNSEWPAPWTSIRERMEAGPLPEPWENRERPRRRHDEGSVFGLPIFRMPPPGAQPAPFGRRDGAWLMFDLNVPYVHDVLLPELLQRHLWSGTNPEYQVEVLTRTDPPTVIYQSDPGGPRQDAAKADASVGLFEVRMEQLRRWGMAGFRERGPGPGLGFGPGPGPGPGVALGALGFGRWQMFVQHRSGSLEAVVSRARWRNLAVTAGVLLLILASGAALIRFSRRAQKLAELQMDFVAGVSHELRTPLTVIHTAAYNLKGKVANNPSQVERYGTLIQQESGRLKELVEQVLRFAGAEAGRVIQERELLSVQAVIADTLESSRVLLQGANCVVETSIEPGLPLIEGDAVALKQALQNLLSNAAKYGNDGSHWIGLFAAKAGEKAVEIRVEDRGPGIPEDEQDQVFDPFFRGRRAVEDQVHGTGLGLNLVKKIVEAHGGTIRVTSAPMQGTQFTMRIPAASAGVPK